MVSKKYESIMGWLALVVLIVMLGSVLFLPLIQGQNIGEIFGEVLNEQIVIQMMKRQMIAMMMKNTVKEQNRNIKGLKEISGILKSLRIQFPLETKSHC